MVHAFQPGIPSGNLSLWLLSFFHTKLWTLHSSQAGMPKPIFTLTCIFLYLVLWLMPSSLFILLFPVYIYESPIHPSKSSTNTPPFIKTKFVFEQKDSGNLGEKKSSDMFVWAHTNRSRQTWQQKVSYLACCTAINTMDKTNTPGGGSEGPRERGTVVV